VRLVAAGALPGPALERLRAIYEDGFPEVLRAPFADLLADRAFALLDGDRPIGLAVLRPLGTTGWIFLRYFVVGDRGRGLGGALWRAVTAALGEYDRLLFDVEDPAEHGIDPAEEAIRRRRIAFYTRLGAQLVPSNGYLPPHGPDGHPMLLLAAGLTAPLPPWTGDELRATTLAVYRHRYGLADTDPTVRRTLRLSGI
jgi:hypothetical protein